MLHRLHARAPRAPLAAALALTFIAAASFFLPIPTTETARAAAVFTVNSTGDGFDSDTADGVCDDGSGNCTLRAAIEQANEKPGLDTINFRIGTGVQTIALNSIPPDVEDPVVIDGTTQPGFAGTPIIEITRNPQSNRFIPLLSVSTSNSTVRGLVLNRSSTFGLLITGGTNNRVEGNYIGTDVTGTIRLPNGGGVRVETSGNFIGGPTAAARNVISGNSGDGVVVGSANVIQGNYIGTDATGTRALPNDGRGLLVNGANSRVGGTAPGAGNVISGNRLLGLGLGDESSGNVVEGNFIGTDAAGTRPVPNAQGSPANAIAGGIGISGANNRIGGTEPGAANVIAYNGAPGVGVGRGAFVFRLLSNTVRGNSIFSNGGLGIELLTGAGVTPNDYLDADVSANFLQNFPVITAVTTDGATTTVRGAFNSAPSTTFAFDFYTNRACDPSGHGEGERPFGTAAVTTDLGGDAAFLLTLPAALPPGRVLTATATAPDGSTSEFSPCSAGPGSGVVQFGETTPAGQEPTGEGTVAVVPVFRVGGSEGTVTVNYQTRAGTAQPSVNYVETSGTLTFGPGETVKHFSVPLLRDGGVTFLPLNFFATLTTPGAPEAVGHRFETQVLIYDRGQVPFISVNTVSVREGDDGTTDAVFTISIPFPSQGPQNPSVQYETVDMTAVAGRDYQHTAGTAVFANGSTTKTVRVPVIGDRLDEHDKTFGLRLSNPSGGSISNSPPGPSHILDDDQPPLLVVGDASVVEPASGTTSAVFPVILSAPSEKEVSGQLITANGTADDDSDYVWTGPLFSIPPGATSVNVTVTVNSDGLDEPVEQFFLVVFGPISNASVGDARGVGTIRRPDSPTVQFGQAVYTAGEGAHVFNVTVTRAGDASGDASVRYLTFDGTASERADYATALGTLRFAPGETSQTFPVLLTEDAFAEGAETVRLLLTDAGGAALGEQSTAELVITNGPPPAPGNPIDEARVFVRQHYHDFLGREPDEAGLDFWSGQIASCGGEPSCVEQRRVGVSSAFFLSIEFLNTGYQVIRIYKASFPHTDARPRGLPLYREFLRDTREIGRGVVVGVGDWEQQLRDNTREFARRWVTSADFVARFPTGMSVGQFVDQLFFFAQVTPTGDERAAAVAAFGAGGTEGRAAALLSVTNSGSVYNRQYNAAFVLMQYLGYLRRNPADSPDADFVGHDFWLTKLNSFSRPGADVREEAVAIERVGQAEMIRAFISSTEYRRRFGQ